MVSASLAYDLNEDESDTREAMDRRDEKLCRYFEGWSTLLVDSGFRKFHVFSNKPIEGMKNDGHVSLGSCLPSDCAFADESLDFLSECN